MRHVDAIGPEDDDEAVEPVDPHPDTPDDFDEDAEAPRETEEAVREEAPPDDD